MAGTGARVASPLGHVPGTARRCGDNGWWGRGVSSRRVREGLGNECPQPPLSLMLCPGRGGTHTAGGGSSQGRGTRRRKDAVGGHQAELVHQGRAVLAHVPPQHPRGRPSAHPRPRGSAATATGKQERTTGEKEKKKKGGGAGRGAGGGRKKGKKGGEKGFLANSEKPQRRGDRAPSHPQAIWQTGNRGKFTLLLQLHQRRDPSVSGSAPFPCTLWEQRPYGCPSCGCDVCRCQHTPVQPTEELQLPLSSLAEGQYLVCAPLTNTEFLIHATFFAPPSGCEALSLLGLHTEPSTNTDK